MKKTLYTRIKEGYQDFIGNKRRVSDYTGLGYSEDAALQPWRRYIEEQVKDAIRKSAPMAWAMRLHLLFVANNITFLPKVTEPGKRQAMLDVWEEYENDCDATGRYDLPTLLEIIETERMVGGDCVVEILPNAKLQIFTAEEIVSPKDAPNNDNASPVLSGQFKQTGWTRGFYADESGQITQCNVRVNGEDRLVLSPDFVHVGTFQYINQTRGVSPLIAACPQFKDVYECGEYALAKAKVSQLVAMVENKEVLPMNFEQEVHQEKKSFEAAGINVTHRVLPLGDTFRFETPSTPSSEFQQFMNKMLQVALTGFDMPFTFFDSSIANFYGNKQAYRLYLETVKRKQRPLLKILKKAALRLRDAGFTPAFEGTADRDFIFAGARYPIDDLFDQVEAIKKAESFGYLSPQEVGRLFGKNGEEIKDDVNTTAVTSLNI